MTVAELISLLQQLPAELPVYLADWNEGWAPDLAMTREPQIREPINKTHNRPSLPWRVVLGDSP